MSFVDDAINGALRGLGLRGASYPLTPSQSAAIGKIAPQAAASEGVGVATAGLGPANAVLGGPSAPGSTPGTAAQAIGSPFAGAGRWLVAFGILTGVALLTSESSRYGSLGFAILAVLVASYFVVEYGRITSGLSNLWGGGPSLNPGGA